MLHRTSRPPAHKPSRPVPKVLSQQPSPAIPSHLQPSRAIPIPSHPEPSRAIPSHPHSPAITSQPATGHSRPNRTTYRNSVIPDGRGPSKLALPHLLRRWDCRWIQHCPSVISVLPHNSICFRKPNLLNTRADAQTIRTAKKTKRLLQLPCGRLKRSGQDRSM